MRITIFGVNGPTGRLLTAQSLVAGHETLAVTRNPTPSHSRTPVSGWSARTYSTRRRSTDSVVEGSDALLSTLGVPFSKEPVQVYSRGMERILDARKRHDVQRVVVMTSGAVTGETEPTGGFLFNRVLQPYVMNKIRPSGLCALPHVTDYSLTEERGPGRFTARIDLAHAILRQVEDHRLLRKVGHVITTENKPNLLSMMLREARKK